MLQSKQIRYQRAIEKELKIIEKKEEALRRAAFHTDVPKWKTVLTDRVPKTVYGNLEKAFGTAFAIVFEKGTGVIEKTYNRDSIQEDFQVRQFAFQVKANRKTLKKTRKDAKAGNLKNLVITGAEGLGLGILGIGLPDIVMFVGVLLKGIYETALQYGYRYDTEEERYFILKLMETAMQKGESWGEGNRTVDRFIDLSAAGLEFFKEEETGPGEEKSQSDSLSRQIRSTADAFAMDMALLKFIQGLPVVGLIGGAGNPLYYNKVMKYAELKYRKRYLIRLQRQGFPASQK